MIPGENNVPPVRDGVPPIVENPVTPKQAPPLPPQPESVPPEAPQPPDLEKKQEPPLAPDMRQPLPRPKFPEVGRIPETPFHIQFEGRAASPEFRPHSFYGIGSPDGVTVYPGLLVTYIEGSVGGTAVQEVWVPTDMGTGPVFVSAGDGDIICLKWDIDSGTFAVSNVRVEVGTPGLVSAMVGGTAAMEIGTVTSDGFTQKLRSDFFYTSIYSNDPP